MLLFTVGLWAQSEPLFTHFMFNRLNYNPAYAGAKTVLDAAAIYRNQWWSGVEGSPKTLNVFAHSPFTADGRNGVGLSLISDDIGMDKTISIGLQYAYRLKLNDKNTLAAGIGPRFESVRRDWTKANLRHPTDVRNTGGAENRTSFNLGGGLFFTNPNFYLGLSIPRILKNSLYYDEGEFEKDVNAYYLQAGLIAPLGSSGKVKFYPNLQLSYGPHLPFEFDINANFLFLDAIMLGATYRHEDSVDGLIQYQFDNGFRAGLAIDLTTSELSRATTGSWEILVGYTAPIRHIVNLRYF